MNYPYVIPVTRIATCISAVYSRAMEQERTETFLIVRGPSYYSSGDEDAFFGWLQSIPSVLSVEGHVRDLYIKLKSGDLPEEDLRELIGILYRYKMDMKGLAAFTTPSNASWFGSPIMYWHKKVFSKPALLQTKRRPREGWAEAYKGLMDEDLNDW